tara:strand:+ start:78 stop:794 length:717 start_codon:yes stop_codon:yes gene_type:complete
MLITKSISVRAFTQRKYYESLGYVMKTHKVGSFEDLVPRSFFIDVKVEHLPKTSAYKVIYKCDRCRFDFETSINNYNKANKTKGDFCRKCSLKVYNSGELNNNYGKVLKCGFKKGNDNYTITHNRIGVFNNKWNNNLTDVDRLANRSRACKENKRWRKSVFIRDSYTCIICKDNEKTNLQAHHLNGYSDYKNDRYNIDNGATLCKYCHKSYHKKFGLKNSSKDKFEMYLKEISCVFFD